MTKRDVQYSIVTGLTTGIIGWRIFVYLGIGEKISIPLGALVIAVPILWTIGVWLGYFFSRWFLFFRQFGKFVAVGFTNFAVDLGTLYFLIWLTGHAEGGYYSVLKASSFIVSFFHSYFWNKFWVFNIGQTAGRGKELLRFLGVAMTSLLVNVASATSVVNVIGPQFGLTVEAWAGVGAMIGAAAGLIFSFIGFRLVVFVAKKA